MFPILNRRTQSLLALTLVLALLCAQWLGFSHRAAHSDGKTTWSSIKFTTGDEPGKDANHSCILLDAATLGSGPHSAPFVLPVLNNVRVLSLWTAFASWTAPFSCHFSSRAPPRN